MPEIADLVKEMKDLKELAQTQDAARIATLEEIKAEQTKGSATVADTIQKVERIVTDQAETVTKMQAIETTINEIAKKVNRPGFTDEEKSTEAQHKAARGLLELKHQFAVQKRDPDHPFNPTEAEVAAAIKASKAMKQLMHCTDIQQIPEEDRKALSAFNIGSSGFILAPEMSNRILSCLEDVSDITGLMQNITIAGPSIRFLVDNVRIDEAAWACETSCFANNPQADLNKGLGELEIKPETLRYIICATRDLLEDASVDIEGWMLGKINWAFRNTISTAVVTGDGNGRPRGILDPRSGIIACDTSDASPAGEFTWQDLILLKWQVPTQYHPGARYLMNQDTFGKVLTMADSLGRPIMISMPTEAGQFVINGSPVNVVTVMPGVAPGTTPVAFGNWNEAYMIVNRKAVTMQQDPYSASFCVLYKFESRIGGGIICPNAARLLRIQ